MSLARRVSALEARMSAKRPLSVIVIPVGVDAHAHVEALLSAGTIDRRRSMVMAVPTAPREEWAARVMANQQALLLKADKWSAELSGKHTHVGAGIPRRIQSSASVERAVA